MPPTKKPKPKPAPQPEPQTAAVNGPPGEVLTLAEAAAYLRLPEDDVLRMVREQDLHARQVGSQWRFLKSAIDEWLRTGPRPKSNKEAWKALVGIWKDDPTVDELREEIGSYRRQLTSEDER
jgi:excisionase family DNA binding protein